MAVIYAILGVMIFIGATLLGKGLTEPVSDTQILTGFVFLGVAGLFLTMLSKK